ncbi:hypothetical protein V8F44DRAFT_636143 [Aspergillus fumigatus]
MVLGIVSIIMLEDRDLRGEDEKCRQADNQAQSFNLQVVTKFQGGSIKKRLQLKGVKVYADQIGICIYIHPSPEIVLFKGGFSPHPAFGRESRSRSFCIGAECWPTLRGVSCDICGSWDATQDQQEYVTLHDIEWLTLYYNGRDSSANLPVGARFIEVHLKRFTVT